MAAPMKCQISQISKLVCRNARSGQSTLLYAPASSATNLKEKDVPKYPPVKPRMPPGVWGSSNRKWAWKQHERGEELKRIPQAKERLEDLAHNEKAAAYNTRTLNDSPRTLEFKKYITKTKLFVDKSDMLPQLSPHTHSNTDTDAENNIFASVDAMASRIQPVIEEVIIEEHKHEMGSGDKLFSQNLMQSIFNAIVTHLAPTHEYIRRAQIDENVRLETFWARSGFNDGDLYALGVDVLSGSTAFLFKDIANLQLRSEMPLPEFVAESDDICRAEFSAIQYGPHSIGHTGIRQKLMNVSGHWIGDPCEFNLMSWFIVPKSFRSKFVDKCGPKLFDEQLLQYGMTSSFASCVAQAHNQGFNRYLDITYPFTTQTVLSDGQYFKFFAYQLNTLHLWKPDDAWKVQNLCWATPEMKLFEGVDKSSVIDFNPEALKVLLGFFMNVPKDRGVNLRPYLDEESPLNTQIHINTKGTEPIEKPTIGRFQYRADSVYF